MEERSCLLKKINSLRQLHLTDILPAADMIYRLGPHIGQYRYSVLADRYIGQARVVSMPIGIVK